MAGNGVRAAEPIVVRAYNMSHVPAREMTQARTTAAAILAQASIDVVWRDCGAGCAEPLGDRDLIVRVVAAPKGVVPNELGYSMIDMREQGGTLATVYADRVESLAARAGGGPAGTLLGRAMAHEIGHMLLGTARHSSTGLMRAEWLDREVRRDFAPDWTWSSDEVSDMHRHLSARGQGPVPAVDVVAMALSSAPLTPPTSCFVARCVSK
jgi:hypothetical protein